MTTVINGGDGRRSLDSNTTPLTVEYRPISALRPYPGNARTHSPKQIKQIAKSIREFGFTNPILLDSADGVIAGHGRLEAARMLGMTEVPTIRLSAMTEAQKRAYIIADNKLAEKAGWDSEVLRIELQYLTSIEFDVEVIGFNTGELDLVLSEDGAASTTADDQVPPVDVSKPPLSQGGDLWLLGPHRLLCGDATDPKSFASLMNGARAQMVFTDPPYNVEIDGHARGLGKTKHREFMMASGEMTRQQFQDFLYRSFALLAKHACDSAIHFVCMDWRHLREIVLAGELAYSELKNLVVWSKTNGGMGAFYRSRHELIFVFKSGTGSHVNNFGLGENGRYRTNVWEYPGVNSFGENRKEALEAHPTVKPVEMVGDAIKDCSNRGDIVLDSFMGSGTTLLAAERTGRVAYGLELDPHYVDITLQRYRRISNAPIKHMPSGKDLEDIARHRGVSAPCADREPAPAK